MVVGMQHVDYISGAVMEALISDSRISHFPAKLIH